MFLIDSIKRYRKEKKQFKERQESLVKAAKMAELNELREWMFNLPCKMSFSENGLCYDKCIHFQDGIVNYFKTVEGLKFYVVGPRCKLWR